MSGELAQTLERLMTEKGAKPLVSSGLLVNPNFVYVGWFENNDFDLGPSGTYEPAWLRRCPGWWPFGPAGDNVVGAGSDVLIDNSTTSVPLTSRAVGNGVRVTQENHRASGICQLIPLSEAIKGKRIRLTATYKVISGDNTAGLSFWLKGKKETATVPTGDWHAGGVGYDYVKVKTDTSTAYSTVRHVISMIKAGASYSVGSAIELLNPYFDEFRRVTGGGDVEARLYFHAPNSSFEGVRKKPSTSVDVRYLDNGFTDTPATDGSSHLYTDSANGSTAVRRIEQYIDVTNNSNCFEQGEAWLVAMPVSPSNFGSMTTNAVIEIYSINIEVVNPDTSVAANVISGFLSPSTHPTGFGTGEGGLSTRQMLRYPIGVPTIIPLSVFGLRGSGSSADGAIQVVGTDVGEPPAADYLYMEITVPATTSREYLLPIAPLPLGSVILRAGLQVNNQTAAGPAAITLALFQSLGFRPTGGSTGGNIKQKIIGFTNVADNTSVFREDQSYHHRVGFYEPHDANYDPAVGIMGVADLCVILVVPSKTAGYDVDLSTGYVLALVDPRMAQIHYNRSV